MEGLIIISISFLLTVLLVGLVKIVMDKTYLCFFGKHNYVLAGKRYGMVCREDYTGVIGTTSEVHVCRRCGKVIINNKRRG